MSGANCTFCSPVTKHSMSHECGERWGTIWLCNLIFPSMFQVLFLHVAGNQRLQTHRQRKGAPAFPPPGPLCWCLPLRPSLLICHTHTNAPLSFPLHAEIEPMKTWQAKALLLTHTPAILPRRVMRPTHLGQSCALQLELSRKAKSWV